MSDNEKKSPNLQSAVTEATNRRRFLAICGASATLAGCSGLDVDDDSRISSDTSPVEMEVADGENAKFFMNFYTPTAYDENNNLITDSDKINPRQLDYTSLDDSSDVDFIISPPATWSDDRFVGMDIPITVMFGTNFTGHENINITVKLEPAHVPTTMKDSMYGFEATVPLPEDRAVFDLFRRANEIADSASESHFTYDSEIITNEILFVPAKLSISVDTSNAELIEQDSVPAEEPYENDVLIRGKGIGEELRETAENLFESAGAATSLVYETANRVPQINNSEALATAFQLSLLHSNLDNLSTEEQQAAIASTAGVTGLEDVLMHQLDQINNNNQNVSSLAGPSLYYNMAAEDGFEDGGPEGFEDETPENSTSHPAPFEEIEPNEDGTALIITLEDRHNVSEVAVEASDGQEVNARRGSDISDNRVEVPILDESLGGIAFPSAPLAELNIIADAEESTFEREVIAETTWTPNPEPVIEDVTAIYDGPVNSEREQLFITLGNDGDTFYRLYDVEPIDARDNFRSRTSDPTDSRSVKVGETYSHGVHRAGVLAESEADCTGDRTTTVLRLKLRGEDDEVIDNLILSIESDIGDEPSGDETLCAGTQIHWEVEAED